jgi:hypothetical protein
MNNVPRVELDHRAREARLRLERVERLLVPPPAARLAWLKWLICRMGNAVTHAGDAPQQGRTGRSLSDQRPSYCGQLCACD